MNPIPYEFLSTMNESQLTYQFNIERSITDLYMHMDRMLTKANIGDVIDADELTTQQLTVVDNCMAIEEEWIMDEDDRREASLIQWDED